MKHIRLSLPAPYVGLRPFTENESLLFFGREPQVRELLAKLERRQRFTAVLGASGSGKSSLVRAGLIPALHRGALHAPAGSDAGPPCRWNVCTFQPGDAPLANLANALSEDPRWADNSEHADAVSSLAAMLGTSPLALAELYRQKAAAFEGQSLLLVVDQFEEIFRYRQRNPDEADDFVALLLRSASEALPIYVVITMRSDFLGNCVTFHGFPEAINSGIYLTPRLAVEQIKSVIVSPLTLAGGSIDPVLANRMLNALTGDDELPILQHALLCMWQRASSQGRSEIDADDFNAICAPRQGSVGSAEGGAGATPGPTLSNAIDNHASAIHEALSAEQRRIARQVLLSLVERHEGRDVRRPQTLRELRQLLPENEHADLHAVLDAFRAESAGFVLPRAGRAIGDDDLIDISHESLFRQWQLFRDWLDEEDLDVSELREWQRRATRWQAEGGDWLDDNDRRRAERWRTRVQSRVHPETWTTRYEGPDAYALVDAYIQGSLEWHRKAAEGAQALQQAKESAQRSSRKSHMAIAGFGIAVVTTVIVAWFGWQASAAKLKADEQTQFANAEKLKADELTHILTAKQLATTSEQLGKDNPDQSLLIALSVHKLGLNTKTDVKLRWKKTAGIFGWEKADGLLRSAKADYAYSYVLRDHEGEVLSAQFSPDGKTAITASKDNTARLWTVDSGKPSHILCHSAPVRSAQFSPDGKTAITAGDDHTARLWNVDSGKLSGELKGHTGPVRSAQFSPDGKTAITASDDNTARLWRVDGGELSRELKGHTAPVLSAEFSPDGKAAITTSEDETARLWNVDNGQPLRTLRGTPPGDGRSVLSAQFSPDGKTAITVGRDHTARLWNVDSGKLLRELKGHEGWVLNAQFSPDGKTAITVGRDNTPRLWNVDSGKLLHELKGHEGWVLNAQFSPKGDTVLTASDDRTVRLWDVDSGHQLRVLLGHGSWVQSAQFSVDGTTIVTASNDNTARLWMVDSGKRSRELKGHKDSVVSAPLSPDGKTAITTSGDKTAQLWEVNTGALLYTLEGHTDSVVSTHFSPDNKSPLTAVTASHDGTARVWTVNDGKVSSHVLAGHDDWVVNAQFSPDGKTAITASYDKTARLWDVASGRALPVLRGHEDWVVSAQFSPDGKTAVTASADSTARLWDVASGRQLEELRGDDGELLNAQFSADGKSVLTTSEKGTVRQWPCDSCRPIEEIAAEVTRRVGRELTDQERERFGIPTPQPGKN